MCRRQRKEQLTLRVELAFKLKEVEDRQRRRAFRDLGPKGMLQLELGLEMMVGADPGWGHLCYFSVC